MKKAIISVTLILSSIVLLAQGAGTGTVHTLRILTDANNSLLVSGAAQVSPLSQPTIFENARISTDASGNLVVVITGGTISGAITIPVNNLVTTSTDGLTLTNNTAATVGVPVQISPRLRFRGTAYNSVSTLSETNDFLIEDLPVSTAGTTTGFLKFGYSNNGGAITYPMTLDSAGNIVFSGTAAVSAQQVNLGGSSPVRFSGTGTVINGNIADGTVILQNNAATISNRLKFDALPTVSACGAGSPAVVANSTPMSGAVTIGTTSVATCTITFNGTAYPGAVHCTGSVETGTAANARAMGYVASTTQLVIVPSAAWADSSVVNWHCFSK